MTADPQNYSMALHCANPSACPGGELAKLHLPENVTGSQIHLEDQVAGRPQRLFGCLGTDVWFKEATTKVQLCLLKTNNHGSEL